MSAPSSPGTKYKSPEKQFNEILLEQRMNSYKVFVLPDTRELERSGNLGLESVFTKDDWSDFYEEVKQVFSPNAPLTGGKGVSINLFFDASH